MNNVTEVKEDGEWYHFINKTGEMTLCGKFKLPINNKDKIIIPYHPSLAVCPTCKKKKRAIEIYQKSIKANND